ncbi:MAG: MFS transporter [Oscillospiraceae bacterium]
MESKNKLTFRKVLERFSYGCGDFGCNIIYTAMSAFLLFYYTDYAGISAAAVGTIMLISRIFDGISDIAMGYIVDHTKSRFGKARPWLLRMCIPFAISGVLLFSVPTSWTTAAKLVYIFITYNLTSTVIYTAINVPYSALNALMTQDGYERSVLSIFRNLLATAGTLIINTFTLPMVEAFGNNASAWTKTFVCFGLLAVAAFLINFFGTKERVKAVSDASSEKKDSGVPFFKGLAALFKNKYWIMMTAMLALFFMMFSINGGATVYFAREILGDANLVAPISSTLNIAQIISMFLIAFFVKKFGKRNVFSAGLILNIIGMLLLAYSGGNMALIITSSIIRGIGGACGGATMWAMVSDTIDYGEWKTGYRTEGLTNSACSFGYKIGNGLGSAMLGWILTAGNYIESTADAAVVQPDSAIAAIQMCFVWIPVIVYAVSFVIMIFYKLDKEFPGIIADLKERAKTGNAGKVEETK